MVRKCLIHLFLLHIGSFMNITLNIIFHQLHLNHRYLNIISSYQQVHKYHNYLLIINILYLLLLTYRFSCYIIKHIIYFLMIKCIIHMIISKRLMYYLSFNDMYVLNHIIIYISFLMYLKHNNMDWSMYQNIIIILSVLKYILDRNLRIILYYY